MNRRVLLAGVVLVGVAAAALLLGGLPTSPETAVQPPASGSSAPGVFEDVTARAGIDFRHRTADGAMDDVLESVGTGAVVFDYDGDGRLDLYLIQSEPKSAVRDAAPATQAGATEATPSRLYRNEGGLRFRDVTAQAGLAQAGGGFSGAAADYDGDGDVDLFVFRDGPNRLFRNRGDGTFEETGATAGIAGSACSIAGTLFDADGDGFLDLYVGNYLTFDASYELHYQPDVFPGPLAFAAQHDVLYRNRGDGTFSDVTEAAGLSRDAGRTMGVVACDFDDDGRPDVFTANDASANHLYRNLGGGRFEEIAAQAGVAYGFHGEATGAMAGVVGDVDLDGRPDLHVTDTHYGSLYCNAGKARFRDRCAESGIAAVSAPWVSWGGGFLDFDNDGDLDLFVANGDLHYPTGRPDLLLENDGTGHFRDVSEGAGVHFRRELPCRAACLADFDDDGRMDVLLTMIEGPSVLLRGCSAETGTWAKFVLRGTLGAQRGFGARVTVRAGGRTWVQRAHAPSGYLAQNDPRLHFGLGACEQIESVTVRWPSGREERFDGCVLNRVQELVEGQGAP